MEDCFNEQQNDALRRGALAADMQVMATFYRDVLGLETDWDGGSFAEFYTASGRLALFMYDRRCLTRR